MIEAKHRNMRCGVHLFWLLMLALAGARLTATDIQLSNATVEENALVGTLVGNLSYPGANSFVLVAGFADNSLFSIATKSLKTAAALDYEDTAHSAHQYSIRVSPNGSPSITKDFIITVTPANEMPTDVSLSISAFPENAIAATIGTLSSTDPDAGSTFTYSLVAGEGGTDNAQFEISGTTLRLKSGIFADFETKSTYTVRIQTTDNGGLSFAKAFPLTVTPVDEAPTDLALSASSFPENAVATTIGTLSSTDPDAGSTFTYSLVAGEGSTDNAQFEISDSTLKLKSGVSADFETKSTYTVRIQTTDNGGLTFAKAFPLTVTPVDEAPTDLALSVSSFPENAVATTIGTLSSTDPDAGSTFTYSLVAGEGGTDNAQFEISGNTLKLKSGVSANFEAKSTYTVRLQTTDNSGLTFAKAFPLTVIPVNEAPTDLALSASSFHENVVAATIGTLSSTDPDAGSTFTYSLVVGAGDTDNAQFEISGTTLKLKPGISANFEVKTSYTVRIQTTDNGSLFFAKAFPLTVTDVNDAPTNLALSATSFTENADGVTVGTLTSTDADAGAMFTYSLVTGAGDTDNAQFEIADAILKLKAGVSANREAKSSYTVRLQTTDNGSLSFAKAFTLTVTDVNEAPTDLTLSATTFPENAVAVTIGTLTSTDPDAGSAFTYSLVSGAGDTDNDQFELSGSSLKLKSGVSADVEAKPTYTVRLETTDNGGLTFAKAFPLTVTNVNEAPTDILLTSTVVPVNVAGAEVGTLSSLDPDAGSAFTYSLVDSGLFPDNGTFQISGTTLKLKTSQQASPASTYAVRIRTSDGALTYDKTFNLSATSIAVSSTVFPENVAGATIGTLSVQGAAGTFTYALTEGTGDTDNGLCEIAGVTLRLKAGVRADFEATSNYSVRIQATDGTLTINQSVALTVADANEAPTNLTLSGTSFPENAVGVTVGTLASTDPDAGSTTFTYALVGGLGADDNASFEIDGTTLKLKPGVSADREAQVSYAVRIQTTDGDGLALSKSFTLTVTNVNEAPTGVSLSSTGFPENASAATIGTLTSTDPDADATTFTYALVGGAGADDNASFAITGNTLSLKSGVSANYELKPSYTVRVQTTDAGGLSFSQAMVLTVTNVNEVPTNLALSQATFPENAAGVTIGVLTSTDPDAGSTFTYTLVAGAGDADNASFEISGDALKLKDDVSADFEAKSSYTVRLQTADSGGLVLARSFTLTVTNVHEAPTDLALSQLTFPENASGATIGTLSSTDPDAGATFTYSLVAGSGDADNASFEISGNALKLKLGFSADFEAKSSYAVRLQTTDNGGLTFTKALTLTVTDLNEAPTDVAVSQLTFPENAAGVIVGTLTSADPDAGSTMFIYSLVAGAGDTDNAAFEIIDGRLKLKASIAADFEVKSSYAVRIQTADGGSLKFAKAFTLAVTDVNEAPTNLSLSQATFPENAAGVVVGTLTSSDPDAGAVFAYSLVAGAGDTDNDGFEIEGNTLKLKPGAAADFEAKSTYAVRLQTSDGALVFSKSFALTVTNVNESPVDLALSVTSFPENALGVTIGTLTSSDPDAGSTFTYSLVAGMGDADNARFELTGGTLKLTAGTSADVEVKSSYAVRLQTTDQGGLTFSKAFILTVTDVNEAPTDVLLSQLVFPENAAGITVGDLSSVDPDMVSTTFTYSLVSGAGGTDNASFEIVGTTLKLKDGIAADFEAKASYAVRIQTTDAGGLPCAKTFTLTVLSVNEAPTGVTLSATSFPENAAGTEVAHLTGLDPDPGDTFTFELVDGAGDNTQFVVAGDVLSLAAGVAADRETKAGYSVVLRVTDAGGLSIEATVALTVTNVNEPPTSLAVTAGGLKEFLTGAAAGAVTLAVTDPDAGDSWTLSVVGGADQSLVQVVGMTLRLVDGQQVAFATKPTLTVVVRATDAGGLTAEQSVVLPVIDRDNMPVFTGWNAGQIYYAYADSRSILPADFIGNQGIGLEDDAVRPGNGGDYGGIRMVVSITDADPAKGDELTCESYGSAVVRQTDGGLQVGGVLVGRLVSGQTTATSIALDLLPACSPDHLLMLCRAFLFRSDGAHSANKAGREVHLAIDLSRPAPTDTIPSTSTLTVRINTNNRPPVIALTPVQLGRGESRPLKGVLRASDDNSSAAQITYRVLMPPSRGELLFLALGATTPAPVVGEGTFTQADVDREGALVYHHGNGTEKADAVLFRLVDGDGLPSDPMVLSFTINQDNFAPETAGAGALASPLVAVPGQPLHGTTVFTDADAAIDADGTRIASAGGDLDFVATASAAAGVEFTLDTAHITYRQVSRGGSALVPWTAIFPEAFAGQLVPLTITCTDSYGARTSTIIQVQVIQVSADELRPLSSPPLSLTAAPVSGTGSTELSLEFAGPNAFAGQRPTVTLQDGAPAGAVVTCSPLAADGSGSTVCTVLLSLPDTALQPGLLRFTTVLTVQSGDGTARASGWQPLFIRIPPEAGHASN